ncbi:MAG: 30S ribosomal protein S17 [Candidatus Omnitrophota bacterium]
MGKRKKFIGTVISARMQKTCIVRVMRMQKHPKYSRINKKFNKFKVHDEKNSAKEGDTVRIEETRPISKDKRFRLVEIIKRAAAQIELKDEL